jgi:calcineurin-like phosphoesterase family protein
MSRTFFSADFHYNHGNIIKYCNRPFLSETDKQALERDGVWHNGDWKGEGSSRHHISREGVDMMNDYIVKSVNSMVGPDDTLYFLGDWCFGPKQGYYRVAKELRDQLKCRNIFIIWGNHDSFQIRDLFNGCYDILNVNVNNQRIVLCHYAMAVFDKSHRGAWQLYGHSHSNAEKWLDTVMPNRRSIDVGIDNAAKMLGDYRPFSFEELQNIIGIKPGFSSDHHKIRSGPTEEELIG